MKSIKQTKFIISALLVFTLLISVISPLSIMPVKADEYVKPDNMLYISSSTIGPLKQRVEVVPGATYHFSFGLSNNSPEFTVVGQDKDRSSIDINPAEISKTNKGNYKLYNYSVTIPENIPAQSGKYRVFIGLSFTADTEIYAFDFSLVKSDDTSNTNILKNGKFETNLNDWAWGEGVWFTTGQTGGKGKTEWEDSNVTIKIQPFNESVFTDEKMLYYKSKNKGPLMTRLSMVSGSAYNIYFGLSNNVTSFDIVGKTNDDRKNIDINEALISKEDKGKYTLYKYTFVYPSSVASGLAFIGFNFSSNCEGYIFDVKLALGEDETQKQLIGNGSFKSGLDHWAWDWDAWFEDFPGQTGKGKTEWSNTDVQLNVMPFDESKFTLEAPVAAKDQMLYFKAKNVGPLMQRLNFKSGAEYNISFGMSNNLTTFDIVGKTDDDRNGIGITETLLSKEDKGKYTLYKYKFTFPSSRPDGLAFIGFSFPSNSEGYIFDIKMTLAGEETQKIANGDFKSGLDHWAWDWDAWFETWGAGKGKTEWSNTNVQLNTMDFDVGKFTLEPPAPPEPPKDQMLYFNSKNTGPLMYRLNFKSGAEYNISFAMSNNLTEFDIVGKTDDDRNGIGITETLLSKENKGKYTIYKYKFTFPSSRPDGLAFIGFTFPLSKEGYIFDVKLWLADDTTEKQLISNGDFQSGLDHWAWDWDAWFETWSTGKGKTEWSNKNVELNTMDFDESKFTIPVPEPPKDQMLYYKNNNAGPLMSRVGLTPGQKYYFSYYVSLNAVGTRVVAQTDGDHKNISINAKQIASENSGRHTFIKWEFTVPDTFKVDSGKTTGLAFVGIKFILGYDGYVYNIKLCKADDTTEKQMISNANFQSGLDHWAWDWDAWFEDYPGWQGKGLTEFSNSNVTLNVMDLDESKFSTEIPDVPVSDHRMLQFRNGANPTPFSARVKVSPGQTLIVGYSIFCTDETGLSVLTDGDRYAIKVEEELLEKNENKQYTTYKYKFTIPDTLKLEENATSTFVFVGIDIPYYAEGFLFDLYCYDANDPKQKSLWDNPNLMSDLDNWIWGWHAWFGMGTSESSYLKPRGITKWTNGIDEIKIMDFALEPIDALIADINRDDGVWWSASDYSETDSDNSKIALGKGSIKGFFLTADGAPIEGVKLVLKSDEHTYAAFTNKAGKFYFGSVVEGSYELFFVDQTGEKISSGFFETLEAGDELSVVFTSDISGLLPEEEFVDYFDGYIYTPQLKTVSGVKVFLDGFGEVKTDKKGHFEFTDVPAGDYELYTVLPNGKKYVFRTVSLKSDEKLSVKLKYDVQSASGNSIFSFFTDNYVIILLVAGGAVVLLGSAAAVLFIVLKKKKKAANASETID